MTTSKKYPQQEEESFAPSACEPAATYGASINDLKMEMMQRVMDIQSPQSLKRLLSFSKTLTEESEQEAEAPCQFTVEELKQEIDQAMDDIRAGNTITSQQMHETFKRYRL